jgi:hypothetical protein
MNRTLRRPMFRTGGSAEGITSGLAPRQGYAEPPGNVEQNDLSKVDIRNMNMQQLKDLASRVSYQPRGTNFNDFLINMGLDLVSRPRSGNIFQQVATSAKGPYEKFMEGKKSAAEQKYASESDMFKTLIAAQADILGSEAEGGAKTRAAQDIANDIEKTMQEILSLENDYKKANPEEKINIQNSLNQKNARLNYLSKENAVGKSLMQNTDFAEDVLKSIVKTLEKELIIKSDGTKVLRYPEGDKDPELLKEAYRQYAKFFEKVPEPITEELKADGGRIGYQQGMMVQPQTSGMQPATMPMDQGTTIPEQPKIDYETLRARLPQEITDDIVRLIAASPEALEDFATIATQQDVDQFNKKYSVNLVLPQEA